MIYLDDEYYRRLFMEEGKKSDPPNLYFNREECFDSYEDEEEDDFDEEAYDAAFQKFTDSYLAKVFLVTFDFYPQLRSKRKELKKALLMDSEYIFESMYDMHEYYIEGRSEIEIDECCSSEISINDINYFLHNSKLDHLLENYDEWYKRKVSFENIYVECFYAGVYIKNIHKMLINLMYDFFPAITGLPSEQLDNIYANFIVDAWTIYYSITQVDPDELNETCVLLNLEDYEFETLINYPGPRITRNANGEIIDITLPRNKLNPAKVPSLCHQCKSFNTELYILCAVSRFNQQNSEFFRCRAYEKYSPDIELL